VWVEWGVRLAPLCIYAACIAATRRAAFFPSPSRANRSCASEPRGFIHGRGQKQAGRRYAQAETAGMLVCGSVARQGRRGGRDTSPKLPTCTSDPLVRYDSPMEFLIPETQAGAENTRCGNRQHPQYHAMPAAGLDIEKSPCVLAGCECVNVVGCDALGRQRVLLKIVRRKNTRKTALGRFELAERVDQIKPRLRRRPRLTRADARRPGHRNEACSCAQGKGTRG